MELTNFNIYSFLIFFLVLGIIIFLLVKKINNTKKVEKKYEKLFENNKKSFFAEIFLSISLIILLFSIFGIKYSSDKIVNNTEGLDIVFVLDVSKSMNTTDIDWKTRLNLAKKMIANYIWNNLNNRYWLIIFAWDAVSSSPLTTDYSTFITFLESIDYRNLNKQGSNFSKWILLASKRFAKDENNSKVVILISDWADSDSQIDYKKIKKIAKDSKINFFTIWIWTEAWWKIFEWFDVWWEKVFKTYKWKYVITKLNKKNLKNISNSLWWKYFMAENKNSLERLNIYLQDLEKNIISKWIWNNKKDFSRIFAIISFIFFLLYLGFSWRVRKVK